jgi:hypothetical protein
MAILGRICRRVDIDRHEPESYDGHGSLSPFKNTGISVFSGSQASIYSGDGEEKR